MNIEEFGEGIQEQIEYLISQSSMKLSATALKNFDHALEEAGLSNEKVLEIEKLIAAMLFFYHYKDLIKERK